MSRLPFISHLYRSLFSSWYECTVCGHKVRLHPSDMKIGCVRQKCPNIGLELKPCRAPAK